MNKRIIVKLMLNNKTHAHYNVHLLSHFKQINAIKKISKACYKF